MAPKKKPAAKAAAARDDAPEPKKRLTVVGDATGQGHMRPEDAPEIDDDDNGDE